MKAFLLISCLSLFVQHERGNSVVYDLYFKNEIEEEKLLSKNQVNEKVELTFGYEDGVQLKDTVSSSKYLINAFGKWAEKWTKGKYVNLHQKHLYNTSEQLSESITYETKNHTILWRVQYLYDQTNSRLTGTESFDPSGVKVFKNTVQYDQMNYEDIQFDKLGKFNSRMIVKLNELKTILTIETFDNSDSLLYREMRFFDSKNNVVKTLDLKGVTEYTYDEQNNLVERISRGFDGTIYHKYEMIYNSKNLITQRLWYVSNQLFQKTIISYRYRQ